MAPPNRIRTQRDVTAMVALDTVDLLAGRINNLLRHGRRMTLVTRFTYIDEPPKVEAGLVLDGEPRLWHEDTSAGFHVRLKPGIMTGFGFTAYAVGGRPECNATEAEVWRRYHAAESISTDYFKRRREMTLVEISGGLDDWAGRDDRIVIRAWNSDGVCEEAVVAFDPGVDSRG